MRKLRGQEEKEDDEDKEPKTSYIKPPYQDLSRINQIPPGKIPQKETPRPRTGGGSPTKQPPQCITNCYEGIGCLRVCTA